MGCLPFSAKFNVFKPPILPPDDSHGFENSYSFESSNSLFHDYIDDFNLTLSLLDIYRNEDSDIEWKVDKGELQLPYGDEALLSKILRDDLIIISKNGEIMLMEKKRAKKFLKVKMRPDGVLDFSDC